MKALFCLSFLSLCFFPTSESVTFDTDFVISWGRDKARISSDDKTVQLSLNRTSGSGFQSKNTYLFGSVSLLIKLVAGNSAGTVTAFYMSSEGPSSTHDEIDFEFLGNVSGQPYTLQTNLYSRGQGNKEERIQLWFDPSSNFHNYSILWNSRLILLSVDSIPVRVFRNGEAKGLEYPNNQAMRVYTSIWNGEDWATQGGKVKIDWSNAPFTVTYQGFEIDGCLKASTVACAAANNWWEEPQLHDLTQKQQGLLKWVRTNYLIYDYCQDTSGRFSQPPPECSLNA